MCVCVFLLMFQMDLLIKRWFPRNLTALSMFRSFYSVRTLILLLVVALYIFCVCVCVCLLHAFSLLYLALFSFVVFFVLLTLSSHHQFIMFILLSSHIYFVDSADSMGLVEWRSLAIMRRMRRDGERETDVLRIKRTSVHCKDCRVSTFTSNRVVSIVHLIALWRKKTRNF